MKKIQCKKYACLLAGALLVMVLSSGCSLQQAGNASDETWGRSDAKEIDINSKVAGSSSSMSRKGILSTKVMLSHILISVTYWPRRHMPKPISKRWKRRYGRPMW